jgi:hypothetical protein
MRDCLVDQCNLAPADAELQQIHLLSIMVVTMVLQRRLALQQSALPSTSQLESVRSVRFTLKLPAGRYKVSA